MNKVHDYVKTIKLEEINKDSIMFFMFAVPGAMGDGGAIDLYSLQGKTVCYFYANIRDGFNPEMIGPYLPEGIYIDNGWFDIDRNKWTVIGGGMGNEFYIKKEFNNDYTEYIKDKTWNYYRGWQEFAEEYLCGMINYTDEEKRKIDLRNN